MTLKKYKVTETFAGVYLSLGRNTIVEMDEKDAKQYGALMELYEGDLEPEKETQQAVASAKKNEVHDKKIAAEKEKARKEAEKKKKKKK